MSTKNTTMRSGRVLAGAVLLMLTLVPPASASDATAHEVGACDGIVTACWTEVRSSDPDCSEHVVSRESTRFQLRAHDPSPIDEVNSGIEGTGVGFGGQQECSRAGGDYQNDTTWSLDADVHTGASVQTPLGPRGVPDLNAGALVYAYNESVQGWNLAHTQDGHGNRTYAGLDVFAHVPGVGYVPVNVLHWERANGSDSVGNSYETCEPTPCPVGPPNPPYRPYGHLLGCWDDAEVWYDTQALRCYAEQEAEFYLDWAPRTLEHEIVEAWTE